MKNSNNLLLEDLHFTFTILHFRNKFCTIQNIPIVTIHSSNLHLNLVPCAGLQSHHTASSGEHLVTLAEGEVKCLAKLVTIDGEVAVVTLVGAHLGPQAVANPPCSRRGHSEDP